MPRAMVFNMPVSAKCKFLHTHYPRYGRLRNGHSNAIDVLRVEDQVLQLWNFRRSAANLRLIYNNPIQNMHEIEGEFFNLKPGQKGVQSAEILKFRQYLCKELGLNPAVLEEFSRYIAFCQKHVTRDYAEALSDFTAADCKGDFTAYLEAQRAWCGATRQFELCCMNIDVKRCPKCKGISLYKPDSVSGMCSQCQDFASSNSARAGANQDGIRAEENPDAVFPFSDENWAIPPPALPGACLLTADEQACLSPILPYIRILKSSTSTRGHVYGHTFIAPQNVGCIVKALPRLPQEITFAEISDTVTGLRWEVNLPRLVHMISVFANNHVLCAVFAAHGVMLNGAECNSRLQEWQQNTCHVPRITALCDNSGDQEEYCCDEYAAEESEDTHSHVEYGPDVQSRDTLEVQGQGWSMLDDSEITFNTKDGVSVVIQQFENSAENVAHLSAEIRALHQIADNFPDLFNLCFPYLNLGRADFCYSLEGRPKAFESRYFWLRHIMACDSRFCSNKMFVFVCQNWIQKAQVIASASVFLKKQSDTAQKSLTDIRAELEEGDYSSLNDIISFSRSIQGSVPYWREVRDKVKEFFEWKCHQLANNTGRRFHNNTSGFPNFPVDMEKDIDLTQEELDLISKDAPSSLVYQAALSEKEFAEMDDNYVEDTRAALEVFISPAESLVERVHNFFHLSQWDIHTVYNVLKYRIFDTSISLSSRAYYAVALGRLQFLRAYAEVDSLGCTSLLTLWRHDSNSLNEESELFLRQPPALEHDLDTPIGSYTCHMFNFAQMFRERTFQHMSGANPGFFITGSMAEQHWPELWRVFSKYIQFDGDVSDPWICSVKQNGFDRSADRCEALRRFPHVSTTLFKLRTELLYDYVLGPVLGIDEKVIRYEFADGRGEIHFHSLNWSSRWPIGLLVEEQDEEGIINFARAWLRLSALHPSADISRQKYHQHGNPQGDRSSYSGPGHPSKQLFCTMSADAILDWDCKMCNVNFCHCCINNSYCLRPIRGRNGPEYTGPGEPGDRCHRCRFEFHVNDWRGKDFVAVKDAHVCKKTVDSIPQVVMERNSRFLIQHSKFFRRVWKANCDFSLIVDPDPSKIQGYIISYLCKEGVATKEYKHFFQSMVYNDAISDVNQLVRKVMLKILGHRDRSAQEIFFTATGNPLYHISAKRGVVVNLGDMRRALSKSSFLGKNVVDKYVSSKAGDLGVSLYQFAQSLEEGYVTFSGKRSFCTWPVTERYCETALLLHNPWSQCLHVLRSNDSRHLFSTSRSKFINDFLFTPQCPTVIYSQVMFAKLLHDKPELRPRNYYSIKDAGSGTVESFLKAFGNRSLDADLQHSSGTDVNFPKAPPGWDWSNTMSWGDLNDVDIDNAREIAKYNADDMTVSTSLAALEPISPRTMSNQDQWKALNIIIQHCLRRHNDPGTQDTLKFILHGAAGTGKSYVIKVLKASIQVLTGDPRSVLVLTPTGAAASQVDGETIHRGLGVHVHQKSCSKQRASELTAELHSLKVLIIDEMSMLDAGMLYTVHRRLRELYMGNTCNEWNGLWCVVLSGDFMQLPPVKGTPLYYKSNSTQEECRSGQVLFRQFDHCVVLSKIERLSSTGSGLDTILSNLRSGNNIDETLRLINSRVITVLGEDERTKFTSHKATHFVAYNAERIQKNIEHLQHVDGPVTPVVSCDAGSKRHCNAFDSAANFCGLQSLLWLGKGVRVTLCLNICTKLRLTKGMTGTVQCIYYAPGDSPPQPPTLMLVTFDRDVVDQLANSVSSLPHHRNTLPFVPLKVRCEMGCCYRTQMPFEMCAAFTVHKSQGATVLQHTVVHASAKAERMWPGILYTALSRFPSMDFFALPTPLTGDALQANRQNLFTSGRGREIERLKRLEATTLSRCAESVEIQRYYLLMESLLRLEQNRLNQ